MPLGLSCRDHGHEQRVDRRAGPGPRQAVHAAEQFGEGAHGPVVHQTPALEAVRSGGVPPQLPHQVRLRLCGRARRARNP